MRDPRAPGPRDGGEKEGDEGGTGKNDETEGQAAGVVHAQAQEGTEVARLGAHQEHAEERQQDDVGKHDGALHPGGRRIVDGKERDLQVEAAEPREARAG